MENQTLTITRPDDWHLHLRDENALNAVVLYSALQMGRAIIMPNLKPPVTTVAQARAYRERILLALQRQLATADLSQASKEQASCFQPLMTLYLTDNTHVQDIEEGAKEGLIKAVKLYPAGATTNSDAGVTDLLGQCHAVLESMQKLGMPLLIHGEIPPEPAVDVFDREAVFIDRVMIPLRKAFPELKVVFEHLTTKEGVDYVMQATGSIGATITPQHLLYNRNAIFTGGLQPHFYCLPILKREEHRQALIKAATSGNPRFFLGTDSAPHARQLKEASNGCAGCFSGLHAIELYAQTFDSVGCLDKLEGFASHFGADFYGLPRNTSTITLVKQSHTVPSTVPFVDASALVPLAAGSALDWKVLKNVSV